MKSALRTALCSIITFALVFFLVPMLLAGGIPDFIWMTLDLILPAVAAALLLKQVKPTWIFLNLPIHYGLLILLASPLSKIWGSPIDRGLGWFSYIGSTFFWPFILTILQFVVLWIQKRGNS